MRSTRWLAQVEDDWGNPSGEPMMLSEREFIDIECQLPEGWAIEWM